MPKVVSTLGYSSLEVGIIFAIAPLMRFLTPFLFLKKFKLNKELYRVSSAISIVSTLSFFFTIDNFYLFIVSNIFFGASMSVNLPYIETFAIAILKERYGKSRLYGSIGFMLIALILANFLQSHYIAISYLSITVIFTAIFGLLVSNREDAKLKSDSKTQDGEKFSFIKHWQIWISIFLMQVAFGAFYNFFTIYSTEHNISIQMTSYLWSFGVVCEILMLYFQTPILKRFSLITIVKFTTLITIFRWLLIYLFPNSLPIYFLSQSFHALSFALYHSAVLTLLYNLYQNKRLTSQFFYGFSYGLGGFVGTLFAGFIYGEYIFLSSAIITFLAYYVLRLKSI